MLDPAFLVRDPVRLPEVVLGLVHAGQALIIVGGGDGTINSIVDLLAHRAAR